MSTRLWNSIAERYDHYNARYAQANDRILELTAKHCGADDRVLDIGCGTGIFTLGLAGSVKSVHAVDISEGMLEAARRKARDLNVSNVTWTRADVTAGDFSPAQFDVVAAFNILQYIRYPEELLLKIHAILRPGGRFLSVTDCYGDKVNFYNTAASFLGKIGVLPRITKLSTSGLLDTVEASGFSVLISETCYPFPPNFFIAAQKDS